MPFFLQALIKRHYIHEPFWTLWKYLENIEKNVNILFPEGIFRTERWNEFLTQASTSLAEMKSAITETSRALPDNSLTAETKIACSLLLKNMNMILASLQNLKKEDGKRIQKKDIGESRETAAEHEAERREIGA